jgi:hypothetical protein
MTIQPRFDPSIPNSRLNFAQWQPPMLDNFKVLFDAFGLNHVQMASTGQPSQEEQGKHTFIDMPQGTGDLETNQNQVNIYTLLDGNNVSQLWLKFIANSNETQYTSCENTNYSPKMTQSSLPGGFVVFCGTWPTGGKNSFTIPTTSQGQGTPLCALVFPNSTGKNAFCKTILQTNGVLVNITGASGVVIPNNVFYIIFCELAK